MTASMDTMADIQESGLSHPTLTGVLMALQWHCQLNEISLTEAFPSWESDGVQMAKIQRFVTEQNQQEFFLRCTNV